LIHVEGHVTAPQIDSLELANVAVAHELDHLSVFLYGTVLRSELEDT
jgi:hypothetical protein